ncbi:hypothetical protein B0H14DRAFT_2573498 [Mycena olivaceomarginata]|nr:hypothetical protein B0H14DRAFT_2573498 [Mycena olivaceomarginata]
MFLNSINPKWNPLVDGRDLCPELALTDEGLGLGAKALDAGQSVVFDPNYSLSDPNNGFRIFALDSESPMNVMPSRRLKLMGPQPAEITFYLDAHTVLRVY